MQIVRDFRRRARHVLGPALGFLLFAYFAYHLIQGDHGLLAWRNLTNKIKIDTNSLQQVEQEKNRLENEVKLLNPGSLDLDMLDERVRTMLNYQGDNDIVVVDK